MSAVDDRDLIERIVREVMTRLSSPEPAVNLASVIDHTLLKPDATPDDIDRLCDEAVIHRFAAVCVHPIYARRAVERLHDHRIAVATVVGFPHGATLASVKRAEARELVERGVRELDMVLPIGQLKACQWNAVADDIEAVVQVAQEHADGRAIVKVIIEAGLLTDREKVIGCAIAEECGADYVKTSTGFCGTGATAADVMLMRQVVGDRLGIKAAGGIRTREQALAFLAAGATRIGTSSGPAIVSGSPPTDRTV